MTTVVNPMLAEFAAKVARAYEAVCDEFDQNFFDEYAPMQLELTTVDGPTVRFWEEGLEFYPSESKVAPEGDPA